MVIRVLVIDDDIDIRRNLRRLLESEGYEVALCEHGQLALDYLNAATVLPNLMILDLMMPVMDGFEFRKRQQEIPRLAHIPLIIMTADGRIDEKMIRTSAQVSVRKPADIDTILHAVKQVC
ncbi:MAG TPA: response regulator [Burkholderiales bacterium]|nr:response regulator [Burkholderiales bacterium]